MRVMKEHITKRAISEKELSWVISEFRKKKCWSQEKLSEISGLSEKTIQRIELAKKTGKDSKRKLAIAVGYDGYRDIFNDDNELGDIVKYNTNYRSIEPEEIKSGKKLAEILENCKAFKFYDNTENKIFPYLLAELEDYIAGIFLDCDGDSLLSYDKFLVSENLNQKMVKIFNFGLKLNFFLKKIELFDSTFIECKIFVFSEQDSEMNFLEEKILTFKISH